uniref:Gag-Pol polyprotein n=1 Tax=Tanacetum cinerariifolium TaxID=118510 RepID=A0A699GZ19_TANCI|nr:hypothetical protein [Tanacetum cinerariifolium]
MQRVNNFEEELFKDKFPTKEELAYHNELLREPQAHFSTLEPKIRRGDPRILKIPWEATHLLLTGIGDEIYLTVDTYKTAHEMWIAIERLQQGEYLNIQDVKTNLFWEFGKFTSHDGESMESYYFIFYKMMNEMIRNNLTVATMQEVNEIHAERIARSANPLTLVAAAQQYHDPYYQVPKSHKSYATQPKASLPARSYATTKHKGKEIAKLITPLSESPSKEDCDLEQA